MSIFAKARKCDLKILDEKLGETVNESHKLKDLKKIILASKEYDEESAKEWMNTIINERKERGENEIRQQEIAERRRQDEIQIAEQKTQEEVVERRRCDEPNFAEQKRRNSNLRKLEYEERMRKEEQEMAERKRKEEQEIELRKLEYEERKRKVEMEFELQKIRLGAEGRSLNSNSVANQNVNSMQTKPKLEIHHFMKKFNSDENDISLYLTLLAAGIQIAKFNEIVKTKEQFFSLNCQGLDKGLFSPFCGHLRAVWGLLDLSSGGSNRWLLLNFDLCERIYCEKTSL
ncbi:hypothetical protein AVEN_46483-1 [Araneus ventricosus]|uniref:Uncharacterized protein n=1 Tax=Araneus ventricosus TaxID=182803 RepID=A0A4Y2ESZ2_ARAVE|nr:hypothetical protein AVEN_46483-1 [Araneus ventricosus]